MARLAALVTLAILAAGCGGKELAVPATAAKLTLTTAAFAEGAPIPDAHTCKGGDHSPALSWSGVPPSAKSLALVCDDPDSAFGTWVHWIAYGIPQTRASLPEDVAAVEAIAGGGTHGMNSFNRIGYGGPCPPKGTHRYFFKLYALDVDPGLKAGATKEDLVKAAEGHVVGYGQLMGTFTKG